MFGGLGNDLINADDDHNPEQSFHLEADIRKCWEHTEKLPAERLYIAVLEYFLDEEAALSY